MQEFVHNLFNALAWGGFIGLTAWSWYDAHCSKKEAEEAKRERLQVFDRDR